MLDGEGAWLSLDLEKTSHTIPQSIGGTGVSPVQAQAKACGYHELPFDCNSVSEVPM
jgi:hypothetical protein